MQNNDSGSDLIKLHQQTIGDQRVPTVSARHLHSFLEVGKHFRTWIQDRIAAFGFVEGQDYVIIENEFRPDLGETSGGRPAKEYFLTIDMAKELSMVERNEKGRQARRYFIECERRMMDGTPPLMTREQQIAQALLLSQQIIAEKDVVIGRLTADNAELQVDREALHRIAVADGSLCITDTAKTLHMPPRELFRMMRERQWIYQRQGASGYIGYQAKINAGSLEHKASTISRADGTEKNVSQVRVTPKGVTELAKIIGRFRNN